MEEEKGSIHRLYRDLIYSGMAFGAERWLDSLQRLCERYACLMVSSNSSRELGGGILNGTYVFSLVNTVASSTILISPSTTLLLYSSLRLTILANISA